MCVQKLTNVTGHLETVAESTECVMDSLHLAPTPVPATKDSCWRKMNVLVSVVLMLMVIPAD